MAGCAGGEHGCIVDPVQHAVLVLVAVGDGCGDGVIAGEEDGHFESECGLAWGGGLDALAGGYGGGVVAEEGLSQAIFYEESEDGAVDENVGSGADVYCDVFAADDGRKPLAEFILEEHFGDDRAAFAETFGADREGGLRGGRGVADNRGVVGLADGLGVSDLFHSAGFEPDHPFAEVHDCGGVVADEEDGSGLTKCSEEAHAFLLEESVANGECLVDDEDVGIDVGDDGEGEPNVHAAGVSFDGLIDVVADVGESGDAVEALGDLGVREAINSAIEIDIFAAGEFGVEARTEFEEGGDAAVGFDFAFGCGQGAADQLEEG